MRRRTDEECRTIERFRTYYTRGNSAAERAVERAGIGWNVGVTGYTTKAQVSELGRRLRLRPGMRLLDIGCGRGYPGLELAKASGCALVGSDLPVASLRTARERASRAVSTRGATFLNASGVHLPFRAECFDAVVHTDVLCCLRAKLSVLKACYRLLMPGGRLAFTTIYIAPGVGERDYRRASRVRGCGAAERRPMTEIMEMAGFAEIRALDLTAAFARTTRAYLEMGDRYAVKLRAAWGAERFAEAQRDRRATLSLIEDGLVRRGLFAGRRAP